LNFRKLFALGSVASSAPLVEFTSRFGRTVVLSHLLSPGEFGIGAAIALLVGFAELTTDLGLDRFLILRAQWDDRDALAAVHFVNIVRGLLLAALVFVAAPWIADFLGAPGHDESFRIVAGVVLLRSWTHLEMKQKLRDFRYLPDALSTISGHAAVMLVVYPAALWFGDHRAVVFILFVECGCSVLVSHLTAQHRFRFHMTQREIIRAMLSFGVPLTLNGLGLAIMSQLDRALVSHWFGVETLAFYTVILNLTVIPLSAIYQVTGQLAMSFFARHQGDATATRKLHSTLLWAYAIIAGGYGLGIAACADIVAPLVFGPAYAIPPLFQALLTVLVWVRLCRNIPTLVMLSAGQTRQIMACNLVAILWLPVAALVVPVWPQVETVLACVLAGDVLTLILFVRRTRAAFAARPIPPFLHLAWSFAVIALSCAGVWGHATGDDRARVAALLVAAVLLAAQAFYGCRRHFDPTQAPAIL
jgi:O-antigen/teichoic acid export membrane protein